ncbi:hypothetical protein ASG90_02345 [Nocardioides sp. Soil797]|nr:hypothetical protein ASG90_02345 [Nocardioides sp. Soil797]
MSDHTGRPLRWSKIVRAVITCALLVATLLIGTTTPASAIPTDGNGNIGSGGVETCNAGPRGAEESDFLPMTRWSGATTEFHSRLSWNDIVDKVQREAIMENGMAAGNFLYSLSENMVSGALSFCLLDKAGYELDHAAAGIGRILLDSPLLTLLVSLAVLAAFIAVAKGKGVKGFRSLLSKAVIVGLFIAMVAGASQSTETNGVYRPGTLSPGWFAVTIDTAVTTVASAPVSAMYEQASPITGADTDPSAQGENIFDCSVHMAAMRAKYQQQFGATKAESANAMVPMVMSGIWENSGLATWKIAQYGADNDLAERVYCHHLDMTARPSRDDIYGVMEQISPDYEAWAQQVVGESQLVEGQAFKPQSDKARDVAIVAWAACRPEGHNFSAQVENLRRYDYESTSDVDPRWRTDGTLMIRGGLDDSSLAGDIAQAVEGGVADAGEAAVGALDTVTLGAASQVANLTKSVYESVRGLIGGGDDDDKEKEYDPNLNAGEQAAACNNLFSWTSGRLDNGGGSDDDGGSFMNPASKMDAFVAKWKATKYGPQDFNWGNEAAPIQAFATSSAESSGDRAHADSESDKAQDFLLTLHGNKNLNGTVGVLIYMLSAVGMVAVFGLLAGAVLLAKVMAGVFIVACFFVLVMALASSRDMESVTKFAKAYLGLSLFAWGAIALLAVIGLLSAILSTLGEAFGGWLSILWSGMSPLLAAIVLHKVFKDILHLPSPFKLTAGLAYANTMAKGGANAAMGGLDSMTNRGAGMVKRTASSALGSRMGTGRLNRNGGGSLGSGVHGQMAPPPPRTTAGAADAAKPSGAPPESLGANPTRKETAAARSELQRRASDPGAPMADRKAARRELRALDKQHRKVAMDRVREVRTDGSRLRSGAVVGAKIAALAAVPGVGTAAAGAYVGYKGAKAITRVARDKWAETTGLGHTAMMERSQAEVDAWYEANEAAAAKAMHEAAEAKKAAKEEARQAREQKQNQKRADQA